ncbi:hypothetical protein [Cellulosimicrobium sp. Marseille-Q8652]
MKRIEFIDVEPSDVRPGDVADHLTRELDPRTVAYVDHEAGAIALQIGAHVTSLLPLENYRYSRRDAAAEVA